MGLIQPTPPPYDIPTWRAKPFAERVRMVCRAWADQGYGAPLAIYGLYALKIAAWLAVWPLFCALSPGFELAHIGSWWATKTAFTKFMLWIMLFEGLGFGCGSGPLTGRYVPPIGGFLYYLRPGTTRLPLGSLPLGHRRRWLDVVLYAATCAVLLSALVAPVVLPQHLAAIAFLVFAGTLRDRTFFLIFRSEHYLSLAIVMLLAPDQWLASAKAVWIAIWVWAAISKMTPHFPAVVCVMTSNAPWAPVALKRALYRSFPDDLRPNRLAWALAHTGTVLELAIPALLLFSSGGPATVAGLVMMTALHLFILSQVPMGVPLEWNLVMIYGAFVLWGVHPDVSLFSLSSPAVIGWLVGFHLLLPLYGSLRPDKVSFLLSMRYYAGNWAASVWLFEGECSDALDQHLVKSSQMAKKQLLPFYDPDAIEGLVSKVIAFRTMHLHGRALRDLAVCAVDDIERYEWLDGELIAGLALGWNFGEGHLHQHRLLAAIQEQCQFAPGQLRVITIESQPLFGHTHAWSIVDAADGVLECGQVDVRELEERLV